VKLSVIIPSDKDLNLQKTVDSFLTFSELEGDLEIIVVFDGPWELAPLEGDCRLHTVEIAKQGMRAAINTGLAMAIGDYVMKVDAHCAFGPGFDRIMVENCAENWLMVPRRYSLDDIAWKPVKLRHPVDHHFLSYPFPRAPMGYVLGPLVWKKSRRIQYPDIEDLMIFQGSCWMAFRRHFGRVVGFLDDRLETYGQFGGEAVEIGLKYWLSGSEIKVNRKTWYAHLWKMPRHYQAGIYDRVFKLRSQRKRHYNWMAEHWMNDEEPGMIRKFSWLIDKFWPVPTWPEDRSKWRFAPESLG